MDIQTKIQAIKEVRSRTPMGLKEAKDAIESYEALHSSASYSEMVDAVVGGEDLVRVRIAIAVLTRFAAGEMALENDVLAELETAIEAAFNSMLPDDADNYYV